MREEIRDQITESLEVIGSLSGVIDDIALAADLLIETLRDGGSVYFAGNGGSAADAQHLAAELSGRFLRERRGLSASALTTNTSALTAIANDYGFEEVFARQIEAAARPGDVVVLISTSGTSRNVIHAIGAARAKSCKVVVLVGLGGIDLAEIADAAIVVPNTSTPHVQEAHITAGHILCGLVEAALAGE